VSRFALLALVTILWLEMPGISQVPQPPGLISAIPMRHEGIQGRGCGDAVNEHSPCAPCTRLGENPGVALNTAANCGNLCIKLPAALTWDKVVLVAEAAEIVGPDSNPSPGTYRPCGGPDRPGPCDIGHIRYEMNQYYSQDHTLCGRFKNWATDKIRYVRITVCEKVNQNWFRDFLTFVQPINRPKKTEVIDGPAPIEQIGSPSRGGSTECG